MQYRLSTIFLVFFVVAASLAAFETWGIFMALLVCLAAFCINRAKLLATGLLVWFIVVYLGSIPAIGIVSFNYCRIIAEKSDIQWKLLIFLISIFIWLISVIWLFYRAIKSRKT